MASLIMFIGLLILFIGACIMYAIDDSAFGHADFDYEDY